MDLAHLMFPIFLLLWYFCDIYDQFFYSNIPLVTLMSRFSAARIPYPPIEEFPCQLFA